MEDPCFHLCFEPTVYILFSFKMKSTLDRFMPGHTNLVESNEFSWVLGVIDDLASSTQHTCLTNRDKLASNTKIVQFQVIAIQNNKGK